MSGCLSYNEYMERRKILDDNKQTSFIEKARLFDMMKKMSYQEKIEYTNSIISDSLGVYDNPACSCSFGKDSTLLLYFIRKHKPNIKVLFCNTGVEHEKTYEFRDYLVKEWNLNYTEVKPKKSFWECIKEYGYPRQSRFRGGSTPKCCYHLKDSPSIKYYKDNNINAVFIGLTHDESYQRRLTIINYGDKYRTKRYSTRYITKIHPLAFWTIEDVWRYIKENNIPYNKIYDLGVDRCGCVPCTAHIKWEEQMSKLNKVLYDTIKKDLDKQEKGIQ